jgi:hypothetical protein
VKSFGRVLLVVSIVSSIGIIASCDDDDRRPRDCDFTVTRCRTVCDYYFCDSWGCYPSCFDQCWGECHRDPNRAPPGVADPPPSSSNDAAASDGGASGAVLCASCMANDDCKGGGLCIHHGGAPAEAGADGSPDAAPAKSGFCGYPCAARADCPTGFTCAEIGTSKQCLPISGKCE